ncbi:sensor histidine kinase [Streptomyces sp. NPDC056069]|uniref:sensor histidine kinase n=1 Tax=Streptomyces sp. NPDC056069 TaxID=3345702 RepID=UPI0035DBD2F2
MNAWSENAPSGSHRAEGERQLAAAALCAAATLALSGLWVCYLLVNLGSPGVRESAESLGVLVYGLPAAAAGVLVHAHRPGRPVGWALVVYSMAVILPAVLAAPVWLEAPPAPVRTAVLVFEAFANLVKVTLWYSLPLWFPDGRLTRRWRWYVGAVGVWVAPQAFSYASEPERFGLPNPLADGWWADGTALLNDHLGLAQELTHYALIAVSSGVMLVRIRRTAPGPSRRPLLLLLGAYLLWAAAQSVAYHFGDRWHWPTYWLMVGASVVWTGSVGYLVVRTGSWRISRAARRILAGLLVVALLTAADVAVVALLVGGMTPSSSADALVLVGLAFLMGAGLRRTVAWAVGLVDRLYYGDRAHPYQVLHTLAERISHAGSSQDIPETLCATVVETLRLPAAVLAVHTRAGTRVLARVGDPGERQHHFEMLHHGTVVGRLSVGPRAGEPVLDEQDTVILSSLASQAAPAVASLRLQEDLRSSREQIVTAREEERRRLRRDIHDGLGPALAGLRLRVENATARLPAGDGLRTALRDVSDDLGMAIKEVRRITDRLGPAPLGELGLTGALSQLVSSFDSSFGPSAGDSVDGVRPAVGADLDPSPLPPLPAAVEVAAYRIAAEALTNVLRHARATRAEVRVRVDADALTLTVEDDGIGLSADANGSAPGDPRGVGLRSMAERAAEIGGRCTVESPARRGRGTRVRAVLPRTTVAAGDPPAPASFPATA